MKVETMDGWKSESEIRKLMQGWIAEEGAVWEEDKMHGAIKLMIAQGAIKERKTVDGQQWYRIAQ